ncbi:uncharacterized protein [Nicotiana sylvestris]|uniref:uncharacterized protein n=1 Tax=Nicotiana sylvestris TaxID=4096 RepID=UPI00388C6926
MSRYICSITESDLKQVKEDCRWEDIEVVILAPEEDITTHVEGPQTRCCHEAPSVEEEVPKSAKDKKRKRVSTSEDPKPKKSKACKPKTDTVPLPVDVAQGLREEEEEDEDDGSELVARVKKNIEASKAAESVRVEEIQPRTEEVPEEGPRKIPESSETIDASRRNEQSVGMPEGASSEALRNEENAPSDSLGQ